MSSNSIGLQKSNYKGLKSTLCTGCGHDSITNHIISAYYVSNIKPTSVAKMSGIGCSSKTPAYFMNQAHGINSLHGRMAPMTIGAKCANRELNVIGISGDGDSASIGLGGFLHLIRRNLPCVYLVYNNGVYGLTKGQFSATASEGSTLKTGEVNPFYEMDLCSLAINAGATFVARSFSGDAKQVVPLLQAAIHHRGTAFIDIISPCITFNNHSGSTKSYDSMKEMRLNLNELGLIEEGQEIEVDYAEGEVQEVKMHDGSKLLLKKLQSDAHDVTDSQAALKAIQDSHNREQILTGMFYLDENKDNLLESLNLQKEALIKVDESLSRPSKEKFEKLIQSYR